MTLTCQWRSHVGVEEVSGLEDAKIADHDVGGGNRVDQHGVSVGGAQIGGHAAGVASQASNGVVHLSGRAAIDDDRGAGVGKALGDGEADAFGRARDDRDLSGQVDVHRSISD